MKSVLVIDDDEMALVLLRTLIEDAGYRVFSTADGPHGVEIFRVQYPDLVVLDLGLPSMNGIEVLRELKRIDATARVLVVSGYISPQSIAEVQKLGAVDFLEKPVNAEELVNKIRLHLST